MPSLLIKWFIFEYQRLAIFDGGFNTEMQQVPKKIELLWSLVILMALRQGMAALTKTPGQAAGILDPHNESRLEAHEHDSQKRLPGHCSRPAFAPDCLREKHPANSWSASVWGLIRVQQ
jgi:hypothetical protein